jgi:hypothetical protein
MSRVFVAPLCWADPILVVPVVLDYVNHVVFCKLLSSN